MLKRFDNLTKQAWFICDNLHISYEEVLDMTVTERLSLIDKINFKFEETKKAVDAAKLAASAKKS